MSLSFKAINSNTPGKISIQGAITGEFGRNYKQAESHLQQLHRALWAARSQKAAPVWSLLSRNQKILHINSELGLKSWKKPHTSVELTTDKGMHAQRSDIYIQPTTPYARILNSLTASWTGSHRSNWRHSLKQLKQQKANLKQEPGKILSSYLHYWCSPFNWKIKCPKMVLDHRESVHHS